jgi:L-alanine-DL-glutamate epimerase-like enolase superfamily enzyme
MEMALFDIKGKAAGLPVYELLGGQAAAALPVYASGGSDKPDTDLRREMNAYVAAGYFAVKIRVINLSEQQVLSKVRLCHEALDGKLGLAVDAVQSNAQRPWTLKEAKRYAAILEPFNLLWLEEPLPPDDLEGLRELRRSTSIPIAGAETATTVMEANRYILAEALDILQPDASVMGMRNFVRTGMLAEAAGMEVAVHAWCGGVGHMANYHAAFATPSCRYLEMSSVYNPLRDAVLIEPWKLQGGSLALPQVAGLGVQLTPEMEKEFAFREGTHYRYGAS